MGITLCILDSELQMTWDKASRVRDGLSTLALDHRYDPSGTLELEVVAGGDSCGGGNTAEGASTDGVKTRGSPTDQVELLRVRVQASSDVVRCILHSKLANLRSGTPPLIDAGRRIRLSGCRFVRLPCPPPGTNSGGELCCQPFVSNALFPDNPNEHHSPHKAAGLAQMTSRIKQTAADN
jgi:hypothetical protein